MFCEDDLHGIGRGIGSAAWVLLATWPQGGPLGDNRVPS